VRLRMHWGVAVALFYSVFALSTVGFVVYAMSRDVDLVSEDYYARALAHDDRLQARANADALGAGVGATVTADHVRVRVPAAMAPLVRGTVTLYRPADARADRAVALVPAADGTQSLAIAGLAPGLWRLQMQWSADGHDYYAERDIRIP
jgi:nitrogen fixation protein FixH